MGRYVSCLKINTFDQNCLTQNQFFSNNVKKISERYRDKIYIYFLLFEVQT